MKRFTVTLASILSALGITGAAHAAFLYTIDADSGAYASSSGEVSITVPALLTTTTMFTSFTSNTVNVYGAPLTTVTLEPQPGFGNIELRSDNGAAGVCCITFTSAGTYPQFGLVIAEVVGAAAPEPSMPWLLCAALGAAASIGVRRRSRFARA